MSQHIKNVCSNVVAHDLCSGCGVCAGICPAGNLQMQFNKFGEYIAVDLNNHCSEHCQVCLHACPFFDHDDNEDTLGRKLFAQLPNVCHTSETGYYLQTLIGYSNVHEHRKHGASGGLVTWTLETLLSKGLVDAVACVSPTIAPDKLFKFVLCRTPDEVRRCSKSCYYPVEVSEIIQYILTHDGRYALVGLPCVLKSLRLAMQANSKLRKRIIFLLGLVCGQNKSKYFSEYICALGGGNPRQIKELHFREKDETRPASDYGLRFFCGPEHLNSRAEGIVYWSEGMGKIWCDRDFTLNACNYCDDLFAELADISFMDAWLPDYMRDFRGTNIVLVRNPIFLDLFQDGSLTGDICTNPITIAKVVASQRGALFEKREKLAKRLSLMQSMNRPIPRKRIKPQKLSLKQRLKFKYEYLRWKKSKQAFLNQRQIGVGLKVFRRKMYYFIFCDSLRNKISRIKIKIANHLLK